MKDGIILWEAHRAGAGGTELPESCLAAFEFGWGLGGRPEADVNLTSDGVMVSVHDPTLDRIGRNLPDHLNGCCPDPFVNNRIVKSGHYRAGCHDTKLLRDRT